MLMQTHEARLDSLRKELARRGLDGFVVPISDEHMSEYVGAYAQRLAWLTGFGGSAGTVAVLKDKAAIFVDGRYTLQVRDQVDDPVPEPDGAHVQGEEPAHDRSGRGRLQGLDRWSGARDCQGRDQIHPSLSLTRCRHDRRMERTNQRSDPSQNHPRRAARLTCNYCANS